MKNTIFNYCFLAVVIVATGMILLISNDDNAGMHVLSLGLLAISACVIVKWDLWHPFVWYSVFFFLYACSYTIVYCLTGTAKLGYAKEIMVFQWLALSVILLIVGPNRIKNQYGSKRVELNTNEKDFSFSFLNFVELVLVVLSLGTAAYALLGGFSGKKELYASGNLLITLGTRAALLLNVLFFYHETKYIKLTGKINKRLVAIVMFTEVFFSMVTGERDRMLIFIIGLGYLLYSVNMIRKWHLSLLFPIFIVGLPILSSAKYLLLTGSLQNSINFTSLRDLLVSFFSDEFYTVGRNLMVLYNNRQYAESFFMGSGILNDIVRVFVSTSYSHSSWFSQNLTNTTGWGFTIVGVGYVNFGVCGIVLVAVIIGVLIRFLYHKSNKSEIWRTIYIYMIPVLIYSTRADLANIFSPLVVHTSIALGLVYVNRKVKLTIGNGK